MYLSVCFCVWNEENNIPLCIDDAINSVPEIIGKDKQFEIIIIDNASSDSTPVIVSEIAGKDSRVKLIRHPENYLYSGSHRTAFKESKGEYVIIIDGDYQHRAKDIKNFITLLNNKNCDVVFGWKKHRKDSLARKLFSFGLKVCSRIFIGHNLNDINCGYRGFKKSAVKSISINEKINSVGPEIICECRRLHLKVGENIVDHYTREEGEALFDNIMPLIKGSIVFLKYLKILRKKYNSKPVLEVIRL